MSKYQWWNRHGKKAAHRWWIVAFIKSVQMNIRFRDGRSPVDAPGGANRKRGWEPYPCRMGRRWQDGEVHPVHWHIGRAKGKR